MLGRMWGLISWGRFGTDDGGGENGDDEKEGKRDDDDGDDVHREGSSDEINPMKIARTCYSPIHARC